MNSLAMLLLPMLKRIMHEKGVVTADIVMMWTHIVGEEVAQYTFPERLEFAKGEHGNGTLRLRVPGGAFALEVRHREKFLIEKINTFFGYNAVGYLKIVQDVGLAKKITEKSNQPSVQKTLVSKEEENYIEAVTGDITNVELREKLQRLGRSVFNYNHK